MLISLCLALAVVFLAMLLRRNEHCLILFVAIVPVIGLLRRLASGGAGRVDFDPLILAPYGVLLIFLLSSPLPRLPSNNEGVRLLCASIGASIVVSGVASYPVSVPGIFSIVTHLFCLALIALVASGRLNDPIPVISRVLLLVAVPCAVYSILQFVYLYSWDRAWMIASGLNSVGSPEPFEVRVFGTSESPGPFALFIGCALIIAWLRATSVRSVGSAFVWSSTILLLTVSLVLTGVRSALVGLAVCAVIAVVRLGRGWQRFIPLSSLVLFWIVLGRVIDSLSGRSAVIERDRYSVESLASDDSLLHRVSLYARSLSEPFGRLFGNASAPQSDGLVPDFVIRYGYLSGLIAIVLIVLVLTRSWRNLRRSQYVDASLMAVFICCYCIAGNPFSSAYGLVASLIIGSALVVSGADAVSNVRQGLPSGPPEVVSSSTRRFDGERHVKSDIEGIDGVHH